ncbi:unnamed protein product [marine sediment metagenome]|uniref:DUF7507 domain-containing protein n=1 Tax=marine sediment metagenome TaxID=412755 RepID=X1AT67_9ZZZZ
MLPANFGFTVQGAGADNALDSDVNVSTGQTAIFNLLPNETNDTLDAGLVPDCVIHGDFSGDLTEDLPPGTYPIFNEPSPAHVYSVELLNISGIDSFVTVELADGSSFKIYAKPLGDDSHQVIEINSPGVDSITLTLEESGRILSIYYCPEPNIEISKTPNDAGLNGIKYVLPGETVTYTYEVRNTGGTPLGDISITDDAGTPGNSADDFTPTFVVILS